MSLLQLSISTLPANVPRKRRLPTFIETSELKLGEDHFFEDTSILESGVHEPDVSLYTGSKSHQLTRDGIKVKTSTSDRRVTGMRKRKTYGPGGRSHKGGRVPTLIPRTEEKVARSTTEKATAGKMLPNPQEPWGVQKTALEQKFGEQGWAPRKRLSPDALDGIRALHAQYPEDYPTAVLAEQFKVSPEAIRRILKSKWRPNEEEDVSRRQRWQKRGETIWGQMVELGVKAPKKWRDLGIGRINKSDSGREKPRARSQTADKRVVAQAATNDLLKAPMVIAKADQLVKRSLSDRIL
ncbi:Required for respiratory growth protein 9 mitochondrial [Xylographa trunciseda]|nr:Required for respiratory growth protein 9 mitochondrial [Xylographa trunciseda]